MICVSESTRRDLLHFYEIDPGRAVTIHSGLPKLPAPLPVPGLPANYILFVSTIEPRKDLGTLIDAYERRAGYAIDPEWLHELALHTQITKKKSELCYQHGRLLYATVRDYVRRQSPTKVTVLETGTARGFSSLCMARALDDAGVAGTVITFDVLPHDVPMYWNCIDDLDGPRSRAELLRPWADLVERCRRHPLARAVRCGGLVLHSLQDLALAYLRRDGTTLTLQEAAHHHYTAAWATVVTSAVRARERVRPWRCQCPVFRECC